MWDHSSPRPHSAGGVSHRGGWGVGRREASAARYTKVRGQRKGWGQDEDQLCTTHRAEPPSEPHVGPLAGCQGGDAVSGEGVVKPSRGTARRPDTVRGTRPGALSRQLRAGALKCLGVTRGHPSQPAQGLPRTSRYRLPLQPALCPHRPWHPMGRFVIHPGDV